MDGLSPEEQLTLYDLSPVVVYTCKPYGDFAATFIGQGVRGQMGWEPSDFLDDPGFWASRIHPDDKERVFAGLSDLFEHNRHSHEYRFQHKDGTYHWMNDTLHLERDESGSPVRMVGYWVDVTARHQAEQALADSEARFRGVVENLPASLSLKDLDGCYQFINPKFTEWFGLQPEDMIGQTMHEVLPAQFQDTSGPLDQKVVETGQAHEIDRDVRFSDGKLHTMALTKFPVFDLDNKLVGIGTINTDVTERKQVEKELLESRDQLRLVTDNLPAWITYIDKDRRYQFVNQTSSQWLARPVDEIVGRKISELLGQDYEKIRPRIDGVLNGEQLTFVEDLTYPDGITRAVQITYIPHVGVSGSVEGYFTLVEDISELKRTEEALRQAQKMEAVGQLTGGVAHDFNNLLAVISGNAELLGDKVGDDRQLATIRRATNRGAELTQRLLAFSRQQTLEPQSIDLADLVASMSNLIMRTLGEAVEIQTNTDPGLESALADPGQVENALLNLAINARDAMPGGGKLTIECLNARLDEDYVAKNPEAAVGDYVVLAVTDTGVGMSEDVQAHALEPFYTTKEVGAGSGLGLSMIYGFVKQSGGHLSIYSELGQGTTVKLYLPSTEAASKREETDSELGILQGGGESILVIEDDPDVRDMAQTMLIKLGYQVVVAPDAASARETMASGMKLDLVLSDVVLPGGTSGPEFGEEVRARDPDIRIIYMSGYPAEAAKRNGFLGSDNVLLNKPFQLGQLAKALRRALD